MESFDDAPGLLPFERLDGDLVLDLLRAVFDSGAKFAKGTGLTFCLSFDFAAAARFSSLFLACSAASFSCLTLLRAILDCSASVELATEIILVERSHLPFPIPVWIPGYTPSPEVSGGRRRSRRSSLIVLLPRSILNALSFATRKVFFLHLNPWKSSHIIARSTVP